MSSPTTPAHPFLSSTNGSTVEYVGQHPDVVRGDFKQGRQIVGHTSGPSHTILRGPEGSAPAPAEAYQLSPENAALADRLIGLVKNPPPSYEYPTGPTLPLRRRGDFQRSPSRTYTTGTYTTGSSSGSSDSSHRAGGSTAARPKHYEPGKGLNAVLGVWKPTRRPSRRRKTVTTSSVGSVQSDDVPADAGLTQEAAAIRIQAAARGLLARQLRGRLQTQQAEADSLREFVQLEQEVNREDASECIQRAFRCYAARGVLARLQAERQERVAAAEAASTNIQRIYRGHHVRRRLKAAATNIQRIYRGHRVRRDLDWVLVDDPAAGIGSAEEVNPEGPIPLELRVSARHEGSPSFLQNLINRINQIGLYVLLILIPVLLFSTPLAIAAYQSGHLSIFSNMITSFFH